MSFELREYQEKAVSNVLADWRDGYERVLVMAATGTGKTQVYLALCDAIIKADPHARILILAHTQELIYQPIERAMDFFPQLGLKMGIVMANHDNVQAQVVVATVQTLSKGNRLSEVLRFGQFTHVITDEAHHCHVPGTMIGNKKIEDYRVGDGVVSFNGKQWEIKTVTNTFDYWHDGAIYDIITDSGNMVSVTGNHQLYSMGERKYARDIRPGDSLSMPALRMGNTRKEVNPDAHKMESPRHEALPNMPKSNEKGMDRGPQGASQGGLGSLSSLRKGIQEKGTGWSCNPGPQNKSREKGDNAPGWNEKKIGEREISCVSITTHERQQSHEQTASQAEDDKNNTLPREEREPDTLWEYGETRQWRRTDPGRKKGYRHISECRLPVRSSSQRRRKTIPLQDRCGMAGHDDRFGDRWNISRDTKKKGGRQAKGCQNVEYRMEDYQNEQPRCPVIESAVNSVTTRHYTGLIYDIEVADNHNYIANGILSSNSTADTYQRIYDALDNPLVVGFTATPKRTDDVALGLVYKKVSFKYTIQDAIRDGWLCPFTPLGFYLPVIMPHDLEFKDGDDPKVGKLLSADNVLEIVYEKWLDNAANRQTIGFTASVAQAHTMAEYFSAMGTPAMAIDGTTKDEDRKRILTSYKKGEIKALWNCQVLTEGFDAPETSCLLMVAPTKSDLVYTQRLGRGLRLFPGKEDCLILDFAPSNVRDLVFSVDLLDGIPKRITEQREKAEQQGVLFSGFAVNRMGEVGFIDPHDVTAKVLEFLGKNKLAWTFDGKAASATVNQSTTLMILMPERDRIEKADELRREKGLNDKQKAVLGWISQYRVYSVIKRMGENQKGSDTRLETVASTIDEARTFCESAFEPDGLGLKRKPWRDGPMSDKQADLLKRIGGFKPGLTKGQAAQQITHSLAFKAVQGMEKMKQEVIFREGAWKINH